MKLRVHPFRLTDRYVWRCAREAIPVQDGLLIELEQHGVSGFGEASAFMVERYNAGLAAMSTALRRVEPLLLDLDPSNAGCIRQVVGSQLADDPFVRSALDCAVHDLRARLRDEPLWRALELANPHGTLSSYSIGLDTPELMLRKLREQPGWSAYKIKLASPRQIDILRALRAQTRADFFVDGNCGWSLEDTLSALPALVDLGVTVIEQPFARDAWAAARELKAASPIPVYADESCADLSDVVACRSAFDGINVKLMKAGGLSAALQLLTRARELGLGTMLGCLPESSAGVAATAHLASLADFVDLDSISLLAVDTGTSVTLDARGVLHLPDRPGTGFLPDFESPAFGAPSRTMP